MVHGADLGKCGESDYRELRRRAQKTVLDIIKLTRTQKTITRPSRLITFLESGEWMEEAVRWLEVWSGKYTQDKHTKKVAKYAKQRFKKQS